MSTFERYYDINPVSVIDQNQWDYRTPEVAMQFRTQPVVYTPLVEWTDETARTGAQTTIVTEMLEGDIDFDEIPFTANYIDAQGVDSRARTFSITRYGDKVQMHESSNIFQQWRMGGGRDWRPLLRGILGQNVVKKFEILARNAHLLGPQTFWTYSGDATNWGEIESTDVFELDKTNEWNLRLGNTGSPVIPGDRANAKLCLIPPGCTYDFFDGLASASSNEASMWRDASLYAGSAIRYELGSHKNVRFVEVPNDKYGFNLSVLYNCGALSYQYGVTSPITPGDGAPDPETTKVDDVWMVGQKDVTHYIQLEAWSGSAVFAVNDIVSIHTQRTATYGVTNGVNPLSGKTITRRIVSVDNDNYRLAFDRPILTPYTSAFNATADDGAEGLLYAFVTKARHIGMCLVLGSRGGILGGVGRAIRFYEPKPVDDFESVWRFTWDIYSGYNIWEPHLFEVYFCALTLPKPGGVITP